MLGHDAGAAAQHSPGQQRTQQGVADAGPGGGDAVFPAELAGIAHEHHRGEIRGAVSEGGQPGADAPAAQDKAVDVGGVPAAVQAHGHHNAEKDYKKCEFDEQIHENTPLFIAFCAYFLKLSTGELRVRTGNLSR